MSESDRIDRDLTAARLSLMAAVKMGNGAVEWDDYLREVLEELIAEDAKKG